MSGIGWYLIEIIILCGLVLRIVNGYTMAVNLEQTVIIGFGIVHVQVNHISTDVRRGSLKKKADAKEY